MANKGTFTKIRLWIILFNITTVCNNDCNNNKATVIKAANYNLHPFKYVEPQILLS